MSLASMMDSVSTAVKPFISKDAFGGTVQTFTVPPASYVHQGLACSYQEASARTVMYYAQRNITPDATVLYMQDPGDLANCLVTLSRGRIGDAIQLNPIGKRDPIQQGQTWVWPVDCVRPVQPA